MQGWSSFYPDVLRKVPGAIIPVVDMELRKAAQEFCEKTLCWRDWLDPLTTTGTDLTYDFNVSSDQVVVQLLNVTLDNKPIDVLSRSQVPADWRTAGYVGTAAFSMTNRTQFSVIPLQAAGIAIATEVALKPSNTATGVNDDIFGQYKDVIAGGAIGRLHALPGWGVPGSDYAEKFQEAIARIAIDVFHASSPGPARVRASFL